MEVTDVVVGVGSIECSVHLRSERNKSSEHSMPKQIPP